MNKLHNELKNIHQGKDIYVIGAGASMSYIDSSFFLNKIVIGVNNIWRYFPVSYLVVKHQQFIEEPVSLGIITIASMHDCGDRTHDFNRLESHYKFTHKLGRFGNRDGNLQENLDCIGVDDDIFVSHSTITSALHLAAYMGAKNIIVAGHDCGYINSDGFVADYGKRIEEYYDNEYDFKTYYNEWFDSINQDSILLKKKLQEVFNCNIVSINPFINFRMEGNSYAPYK